MAAAVMPSTPALGEGNNHGCTQPRTVAKEWSPFLSEVLKTNTRTSIGDPRGHHRDVADIGDQYHDDR